MARTIGWLACAGAVLLLVAAMAFGLAPAAAGTAAPEVVAAWVQLSPVPGRPAAGYFTLRGGPAVAELVAVASPLARIELHSSSMAGGVMRMDTLPSIRIAARGSFVAAPGGTHLMLFDPSPTIRPGATVPLSFRFADGTTVRVDAVARAAGAAAADNTMPGHGAH